MLVNKPSTSKLAMWRPLTWGKISSTKVKESLTENSFCIISDRNGTKNFASLYVGVPIAERMGVNDSNPVLRGLCTLADP